MIKELPRTYPAIIDVGTLVRTLRAEMPNDLRNPTPDGSTSWSSGLAPRLPVFVVGWSGPQ